MDFRIIQDKSTNHFNGRKGYKPDMIVSHITSGSFDGAVSWLKNPQSKASSHFVISRKGEIRQLVDLKDGAWCNGTSVSAGKSTYYGLSTLPQVRARKTNANYYTVSIEHEGREGIPFTEIQMEASIWLHKWIIKEIKRLYGVDIQIDREHIVGHYQINPRTKPNCPGRLFFWNKLMESLSGDTKVPSEAYTRLILLGKEVKSVVVKDSKSYVWLKGSKIMVPVRELFETLGLNVEWSKGKIEVK